MLGNRPIGRVWLPPEWMWPDDWKHWVADYSWALPVGSMRAAGPEARVEPTDHRPPIGCIVSRPTVRRPTLFDSLCPRGRTLPPCAGEQLPSRHQESRQPGPMASRLERQSRAARPPTLTARGAGVDRPNVPTRVFLGSMPVGKKSDPQGGALPPGILEPGRCSSARPAKSSRGRRKPIMPRFASSNSRRRSGDFYG